MTPDTELCNMALANIAHGTQISDIETETSKEANTCRLFYSDCFDTFLRETLWPKFQKRAALAQITNPSTEWGFAYAFPNNCLFFRRVISGQCGRQKPQGVDVVPYDLSDDGNGNTIILTDMDMAVGVWTVQRDTTHWDGDMRLAFSLLLSSFIAVAVTGGDAAKLGQVAMGRYEKMASRSAAKALNETQRPIDTDSGLKRARGRGTTWVLSR